jgi:outer membrane autotransporter protein
LTDGIVAVPSTVVAEDAPFAGYNAALGATTVNGRIAGDAILKTCSSFSNMMGGALNQQFQLDCSRIVLGADDDEAGAVEALTDLTADQVSAQNSVAIRSTGMGVSVVTERLAKLRLANVTSNDVPLVAGVLQQGLVPTGGGASGDASFGRLGTFFNVRYATGDTDKTDFQPGYDFDGWTLQGGIDYKFQDNLIGGAALRYSSGDVDYDGNRGTMDGDGWGLSLYGSYSLDNGFFVDGLVGYAKNDYSLKRQINYTTGAWALGMLSEPRLVASEVAESSPNADIWNFNIGFGYNYYQDAWSITPSLRLNYLQNKVDSYSERMSNPAGVGGSMALAIDSQTFTSFTSDLGVQIARAISHKGGVILPQIRIGWVHEFENDQERVGARFVNDINATPFYILTDRPVSDYADLTLGVSAQFAGGRSAFLSYNTLLGFDGVTYNAVSAGVRLEF